MSKRDIPKEHGLPPTKYWKPEDMLARYRQSEDRESESCDSPTRSSSKSSNHSTPESKQSSLASNEPRILMPSSRPPCTSSPSSSDCSIMQAERSANMPHKKAHEVATLEKFRKFVDSTTFILASRNYRVHMLSQGSDTIIPQPEPETLPRIAFFPFQDIIKGQSSEMPIPNDLVLFVKYLEQSSMEGFYNGVGKAVWSNFYNTFFPNKKGIYGNSPSRSSEIGGVQVEVGVEQNVTSGSDVSLSGAHTNDDIKLTGVPDFSVFIKTEEYAELKLAVENKSPCTKHPFGLGQGLFYLVASMMADIRAGIIPLKEKGGLFVINRAGTDQVTAAKIFPPTPAGIIKLEYAEDPFEFVSGIPRMVGFLSTLLQ